MRQGYHRIHPISQMLIFLGILVAGMLETRNLLLFFIGLTALLDLLLVEFWKTAKKLWKIILFCGMVCGISPFFNSGGETVLFRYFGRAYTKEALMYGIKGALLLWGILWWCICLSYYMDRERTTFLFGGIFPAGTMIFTMVLGLLPQMKRKSRNLSAAREGIGKGSEPGLRTSILLGTSLEGAVITADSMRARGYGCGKRTGYHSYRFHKRDVLLLCIFCMACAGYIIGIVDRIVWLRALSILVVGLQPFMWELLFLTSVNTRKA